MSSMVRTIRRRMVRDAARRGIEGQRNKRARFATAWALVQGRRKHASPARVRGMVESALRRLGLALKGGHVVEE